MVILLDILWWFSLTQDSTGILQTVIIRVVVTDFVGLGLLRQSVPYSLGKKIRRDSHKGRVSNNRWIFRTRVRVQKYTCQIGRVSPSGSLVVFLKRSRVVVGLWRVYSFIMLTTEGSDDIFSVNLLSKRGSPQCRLQVLGEETTKKQHSLLLRYRRP